MAFVENYLYCWSEAKDGSSRGRTLALIFFTVEFLNLHTSTEHYSMKNVSHDKALKQDLPQHKDRTSIVVTHSVKCTKECKKIRY